MSCPKALLLPPSGHGVTLHVPALELGRWQLLQELGRGMRAKPYQLIHHHRWSTPIDSQNSQTSCLWFGRAEVFVSPTSLPMTFSEALLAWTGA
mmetsp:Transcript_6726/g.15848  ORF Transcript_6726/g.15848 Transcript_6726/m.15848 type:complete len:94 (+) Transcript_6726:272-553(+)